jgi:hypothetical protein
MICQRTTPTTLRWHLSGSWIEPRWFTRTGRPSSMVRSGSPGPIPTDDVASWPQLSPAGQSDRVARYGRANLNFKVFKPMRFIIFFFLFSFCEYPPGQKSVVFRVVCTYLIFTRTSGKNSTHQHFILCFEFRLSNFWKHLRIVDGEPTGLSVKLKSRDCDCKLVVLDKFNMQIIILFDFWVSILFVRLYFILPYGCLMPSYWDRTSSGEIFFWSLCSYFAVNCPIAHKRFWFNNIKISSIKICVIVKS